MIYRLIGAAVLTAGCTLAGTIKAKRLKQCVRQTEDTIRAVRIMRGEISLHLLTVYDVCSVVAAQINGDVGVLFRSCESFSPQRTFCEQWKESVHASRFVFSEALGAELDRLGDFIGRYDAEEQMQSFDLMCDRLEELRIEETARSAQNGRLYRTVGVSVGLIAAILLL